MESLRPCQLLSGKGFAPAPQRRWINIQAGSPNMHFISVQRERSGNRLPSGINIHLLPIITA
jgi:hypothetical protein